MNTDINELRDRVETAEAALKQAESGRQGNHETLMAMLTTIEQRHAAVETELSRHRDELAEASNRVQLLEAENAELVGLLQHLLSVIDGTLEQNAESESRIRDLANGFGKVPTPASPGEPVATDAPVAASRDDDDVLLVGEAEEISPTDGDESELLVVDDETLAVSDDLVSTAEAASADEVNLEMDSALDQTLEVDDGEDEDVLLIDDPDETQPKGLSSTEIEEMLMLDDPAAQSEPLSDGGDEDLLIVDDANDDDVAIGDEEDRRLAVQKAETLAADGEAGEPDQGPKDIRDILARVEREVSDTDPISAKG